MQADHRHHVTIPSLRRLGWNAIPQIVEGAIVPAVLFLLAKHWFGFAAGIIAALTWTCVGIAVRAARGRRIPGLIVLRGSTLVARSALGLASGSAFVYFFQPVVGTMCLASVFLYSVVRGKPLAGRFAGDFCDLPDDVLADHRVHHFFRRASFAWAVVGFANAAVTLWLLRSQTTNTYIMVKPAMSVGITIVMVAASAVWFKWSMNRNGFEIRTA
jgi:intracellular septation protein A